MGSRITARRRCKGAGPATYSDRTRRAVYTGVELFTQPREPLLNLKNLLDDTPGSSPVANIATAFGVDPEKAAPAIQVLTQALADRVERNTLSRGGLADIIDIMARPGAGRALTDPQALATPEVEQIGNTVLDVLLGSKHASRGVAARAARQSGIDEATLKKMLPAVASTLIGALQAKAMPQIEKSVASLAGSPLPLPGERGPVPRQQTSPLDLDLPQSSGGGRSGTGGRGGSPLPIPGDDIPGIDRTDGPSRFPDLPDIIRRGGRDIQVPSPTGGGTGSLDTIIRDILANALGFKNSGILAFILKIIFSRWFLGLLSRILFRR